MVRKKVEGNEEQRRAAAREAEQAGELPSARRTTTGASKQRAHVTRGSQGPEPPPYPGKQREQAVEATAERAEQPEMPPPGPGRMYQDRGPTAYGPEHARVFEAIGVAERRHGGEAVFASEIARTAELPVDRTIPILHDLVSEHRLVTELRGADTPDQGPRYEIRPGR
ncbi:hypothetical protein [Streptomyces hoynatensis]|uniref:Uncharacterized protein n=1 Tax=Streptomyces hoynatensis TaxID=1141874 RepID=A0A3A9YU60_9ACTN|nr:hypothetical protein [Streptomyces hoynatensis]RKN39535.1 hypothetical protein D7294_21375 [Streptomyces hoynatensis]